MSPHRVELQIPKDYLISDGNGARSVSGSQNKIALMTGFSISFPWAIPVEGVATAATPDWIIAPSDSAEFQSAGGGWAIGAGDSSKPSAFSLTAAVDHMKSIRILPLENLSDPSNGIFQSDTGEIVMRSRENLLKVLTPNSEAISLEDGKSERIGCLEVLGTSVPATIAACAVDKNELLHSKRIVLIYATETANTDLETTPDRKTLINLGGAPVLMRTGRLEVTLRNTNSSRMSIYALGLDGSRREKLPLTRKKDQLTLSLDTRSLEDGPTPFFELVVE